ncbi:MAG: hypothetical protein JWP91_2782 [Fibrobacteres bacterium]|nr:hypothetical protein [Fibrobacterota bacterium]
MKPALAAFCLIPLCLAFGESKLSLFTALDLGLLQEGNDLKIRDYNPSGLALNRTYVDVGFAQQLDANYFLNIGVGGIFWKAFEAGTGSPESKVIKFGPGISSAYMKWSPSEKLNLTFGYFPYKYNASARNLGEYLFRTEAYPTIIYTGGWSWINDAQYRTVGAKLTWESGSFKHDLGLFGEYFNAPIYDITPAYIATWKGASGLTLGGAASLHRFINPSPKTRKVLTQPYTYYQNFYLPEVQSKSKFNVDIQDYAGQSSHEIKYAAGQQPDPDLVRAQVWASDSTTLSSLYGITSPAAIPIVKDPNPAATVEGRSARRATMLRDDIITLAGNEGSDSSKFFSDPNNADVAAQSVSFDNAAVKLVAFFELDFNALFGTSAESLGDFGIYGEIAQLGLKNYPIFYTETSQRRPIMLGANIPTFGLLENLSVEMEYLKNPVMESIASTYDKLDLPPDPEFRYKSYSRDDYKWSVHASRGLNKFLSFHVQVANDHMRLKDGFARPEYIPVTNEPSHWYWLTRIQWMI